MLSMWFATSVSTCSDPYSIQDFARPAMPVSREFAGIRWPADAPNFAVCASNSILCGKRSLSDWRCVESKVIDQEIKWHHSQQHALLKNLQNTIWTLWHGLNCCGIPMLESAGRQSNYMSVNVPSDDMRSSNEADCTAWLTWHTTSGGHNGRYYLDMA